MQQEKVKKAIPQDFRRCPSPQSLLSKKNLGYLDDFTDDI